MIEINNILDVEKYLADIDVVIFDLDDTLYSEKDYVKSGYDAIGKEYPNVKDLSQQLWNAFLDKKPAIDFVLSSLNMLSEKERALSIYRNQIPTIHLYLGVQDLIERLRKSKKIGIITDGRIEGQQAKIKALNLSNIVDKIIITDELGGPEFRKPNDKAFVIMKEYFKCDYKNMCYIGDNIKKDRIAPEKLGMKFIHFNNKKGLYN